MLREIKAIRQIPGEARRRWFQDESMDLFVWLDPNGSIVGFQLTYDKPHAEKALTWRDGDGYVHTRVDDGARPGQYPGTPLLVPDGVCDAARMRQIFEERAVEMDPAVKAFVAGKLRELPEGPDVGIEPERGSWLACVMRRLRSNRFRTAVAGFVLLIVIGLLFW